MSVSIEAGGSGAWGAAAALGLAAVWWLHVRRSPAGGGPLVLRALGAAALSLAVLRPVLVVSQSRLAKPRLLILLDTGISMRSPSGRGGTRLAQAVEWLGRERDLIERRAEVSLVEVSDRARPRGGLSGLAGVLASSAPFLPAEAFSEALPAGAPAPARVWLVSDGAAEGGGDLARAVAGLGGGGLDALGVGPARRRRGLVVSDLTTPDFAFLHGRFTVEASLSASDLAGRRVGLVLSRADESAPGGWRQAGRADRWVRADDESFISSFTVSAERLGSERWRLETVADGRASVREFRVEVVRQKYRIMYLAGRPSAEYSFLREFLKSDPNRELVSFVILRNPDNLAAASDRELSLIPFPMEDIFARSLPQFDLFILENFSAARFNMPAVYLENLRRFVSAGGALLVKGGENAFSAGGYKGSPLEEVLPVVLSGSSPDFVSGLFTPKPSSFEHPLLGLFETAEESRRAWEALPELDGWGRFASLRPEAQVVAFHPTQAAENGRPLPVIAARSYGRGKVMLVSTDSTWRWRLGARGDRLASGVYERFWTRAVQYLTGTLDLSKVRFAPLPDRIPPREPLTVGLRVFDEDFSPATSGETRLSVTWTMPDGESREVAARQTAAGVYTVELTGLVAGAHRLRASARVRGRAWGSDEKRFVWEPATEVPMDGAWLAKAAELGGGSFVDLSKTSAGELLKSLPPPRPEAETIRRLRPFSQPPWLTFCALLLLAEWAWRRGRGHA